MNLSDAASLKKLLRALGFEVYRTAQGRVHLAERVRDNLIMDSGVSAGPQTSYGPNEENIRIGVTLRIQASHFPGAKDDELKREGAKLAAPFLAQGYQQVDAGEQHMLDPSDPTQVLDTSHELHLDRVVHENEIEAELKFLFSARRISSDD